MGFDYLRFYGFQYSAEFERSQYVPWPEIAPHSLHKDRLHSCFGRKLETLALGFLGAAANQPAVELFAVEVGGEREHVPLHPAHTETCYYSRNLNRFGHSTLYRNERRGWAVQ